MRETSRTTICTRMKRTSGSAPPAPRNLGIVRIVSRFPLTPLLVLVLGLSACGQNRGAPPAEPLQAAFYVIAPDDLPAEGQHLRYAPAGTAAGGLDIAVTTYTHPASGARVALFGVVHVADALYYQAVAEKLATYDVVLYEGVKPAEVDAATWQAGFNKGKGEVASLQSKLARWFGFQYQLDAIDYTSANFVHADMTEEKFLEGGGGALLSARTGKTEEDSPGAPETGLDHGMGDRSLTSAVSSTLQAVERFGERVLDRPSVFRSMGRRMFAETMGTADIGSALDMLPGLGDLILNKRNDVVMQKLEDTLDAEPGSVAVFYGAAHMPDLESRLLDLGFRRVEAEWLRAWALRPALPR
jgi:hypothetical protein